MGLSVLCCLLRLVAQYPTEDEKVALAAQAGMTMVQLNNWFGNKRMRYKRKVMAEMTRMDE